MIYFLDDNLSSVDPSVQEKSISAVTAFVAEFYKDTTEDKTDHVSLGNFMFHRNGTG